MDFYHFWKSMFSDHPKIIGHHSIFMEILDDIYQFSLAKSFIALDIFSHLVDISEISKLANFMDLFIVILPHLNNAISRFSESGMFSLGILKDVDNLIRKIDHLILRYEIIQSKNKKGHFSPNFIVISYLQETSYLLKRSVEKPEAATPISPLPTPPKFEPGEITKEMLLPEVPTYEPSEIIHLPSPPAFTPRKIAIPPKQQETFLEISPPAVLPITVVPPVMPPLRVPTLPLPVVPPLPTLPSVIPPLRVPTLPLPVVPPLPTLPSVMPPLGVPTLPLPVAPPSLVPHFAKLPPPSLPPSARPVPSLPSLPALPKR
jgi:hypothetical protein